MSKLILNIVFSPQIKFKMAFNTSGNQNFKDLKEKCLERLKNFSQLAPEQIVQEIPASFNSDEYQLQDNANFSYDDNDVVADLCQNNDLINLVHIQHIVNQINQAKQVVPPQQHKIIILPQPQPDEQIPPDQKGQQNQLSQPQDSQQPQQQQQQQQQDGMMTAKEIADLQKTFYLDTSPISKYQQIGDFNFSIKFLQSQNPQQSYQFSISRDAYLIDVSQMIVKCLDLNEDHSVSLYSESGQPLYAWLNQMHQKTVSDTLEKTNFRTYYCIITKCSVGLKSYPKLDAESGNDQIFIIHEGPKVVRVNLATDTVLILKQKIYQKLNIPTNISSLFYAGKSLQDEQKLSEYNIQNNSNIQLSFKLQQIVGFADSYNFNFYSPWMQHLIKQSDEGLRQFRCHTLVILKHTDNIQLLHLIRKLTQNNVPLVLAIKQLMSNRRLSQVHRIALEEGMLFLFFQLIISTNELPNMFSANMVYEYSRKCYAFLLKESQSITQTPQLKKLEFYRNLETNCQVTLKQIQAIALLQNKKTNQTLQEWLFVDYEQIQEKIKAEQMNNENVLYSELQLIQPDWLKEEFFLMKNLDHETLIWLPQEAFEQVQYYFTFPKDWHKNVDDWASNTLFKIHSGVQLKGHPTAPCLTKNSAKLLVVYTSMNKDVAKPVNLFDPMNGIEQAENPDDMAYQQMKIMTGASIASDDDDSDIKVVTQITSPPDEAIVVLFDISGSMDEDFYKSEDLTRLGIVKAFFNAFADRTMAYNLKNVISLVFFDDRYILKCSFTELFMQFKDLVNRACSKGTTALYTALKNAADSLVQFRKQYPNTLLRIIALTDGEDNRSLVKPEQVAAYIFANNIILDSFVVYDKCKGLKQITKSTGGKCFCPKTIQEGLRLFEYETILSAKGRKQELKLEPAQVSANFKKQHDFDTEPYELELPQQLNQASVNPKHLVQQISSDQKQLNLYAPSATLKRVMKEIINYEAKPHPFIKIFPCQTDVSFWKILMLGPEQTPYQGGTYILYLKFPVDYPIKPPNLRFLTPIYHCNINAQGRICHSILDRNYTPDTRILQIFEAVYGLLMTPEPDDPLDTTIASEYIQDLQNYRVKAEAHTSKNAKKPIDEIMKQILGNENAEIQMSDGEFQQKLQDIDKWMNEQLQKQQEQQEQQQQQQQQYQQL